MIMNTWKTITQTLLNLSDLCNKNMIAENETLYIFDIRRTNIST